MCTSFTWLQQDFYFGRNLDLDCSFGECVVITPRKYPFSFLHQKAQSSHYALIGMASIMENTPLYADAVNEKGLGMAGLQFSGPAVYFPFCASKSNVAPFELIPWILGQCTSVQEARRLLENTNVLDIPFRPQVPNAPLHWILADKTECIVLESVQEGLKIHNNPIGVLTNNPPFEFHQWNLQQYLNLTNQFPSNRFSSQLNLKPFATGMGALGLPGDASSVSRFIKTAFLKQNLYSSGNEEENIQQFFRVLQQVSMVKGTVMTSQKTMDYTLYSSCMNATKGIYYYTTYENSSISKVALQDYDLNTSLLIPIPLQKTLWH